ncbi:UDP-N-acetylglucosamine pyrophosphorylase [Alkalispirochaeta americana]|uniref:UDP-N-acetylglucosamine pyrophosphorylase n=1 Tax=Alkalispirochaeta americana TaxID=159291 RepID=A0A1N6QXT7_9SPIO|nr:UTP--glucose-1-phosphate uridylyltransferase [Alkalispirochaeta americana]SIQ21405.1 UDP-N-acetylglucosamine pyrophosphorylase [Alkalispirochaeta americana]
MKSDKTPQDATTIPPALRQRLLESGLDADRSIQILNNLNQGRYDAIEPIRPQGIPRIDGQQVIDRTVPTTLAIPDERYQTRLRELAPEIPLERFGRLEGSDRLLSQEDLEDIGVLLYPYLSYGVLNGGSATSYGDRKKNESLDPGLLDLYQEEFSRLAPELAGKPKGITPAWVNPDGSRGASFLELKFRMVLLAGLRYTRRAARFRVTPPENLTPGLPFFEMTSQATEAPLREAYQAFLESPLLKDFPGTKKALETEHAQQPLLAAFTHSSQGRPRAIFAEAFGKPGEPLGLPGGHGQNFSVLAPIYRKLFARGKRFVYIGNVDNLGFTLDPVSLAITALRQAPGAFDFSFRTPVDVKGGVLVFDQQGKLNCADIGAAISREDVLAAEEQGDRILFNCATGLLDLEYLTNHLDRIIRDLPMRISDQDKDAGRYSQAEQVTWEVIAMLEKPLVFGIDKYRRFLAAKMLLETLLTSGLHLEKARELQPTVDQLSQGLERLLREEYGMNLEKGRWVPQSPQEVL